MGAGNFSDIDEVEAGVDVGRELAVEEIDEDAAGGRGLCIIWADRSGRIEDHDGLTVLRRGDSLLLGHEL